MCDRDLKLGLLAYQASTLTHSSILPANLLFGTLIFKEFSSLVETNICEIEQSEPAMSVASNATQNTEVFHSKCGTKHLSFIFLFYFLPQEMLLQPMYRLGARRYFSPGIQL